MESSSTWNKYCCLPEMTTGVGKILQETIPALKARNLIYTKAMVNAVVWRPLQFSQHDFIPWRPTFTIANFCLPESSRIKKRRRVGQGSTDTKFSTPSALLPKMHINDGSWEIWEVGPRSWEMVAERRGGKKIECLHSVHICPLLTCQCL